jgi:hypothetical protein
MSGLLRHMIVAGACLAVAACSSYKTYTADQLRLMVAAGNFPAQSSPRTASEAMDFPTCLAKIASIKRDIGSAYPSREIVSTPTVQMEKVWSRDAALTLTCSALDGKFVWSSAAYT